MAYIVLPVSKRPRPNPFRLAEMRQRRARGTRAGVCSGKDGGTGDGWAAHCKTGVWSADPFEVARRLGPGPDRRVWR